jgi:hypothetical protein
MKVIFLDFYGVMDGSMEAGIQQMQARIEARERGEEVDTYERLNRGCGALINRLIELTDAYIVIISDAAKDWSEKDDWIGWDPDEEGYTPSGPETAVEDLVEIDIPRERILGWTYQCPSSTASFDRPREVWSWLQSHPEVTEYVILDDKPLPFTREAIEKTRAEINSWENQQVPNERWLDALLPHEVGEAMAPHFIQVDGRPGLTREDVEKAVGILGGPDSSPVE